MTCPRCGTVCEDWPCPECGFPVTMKYKGIIIDQEQEAE